MGVHTSGQMTRNTAPRIDKIKKNYEAVNKALKDMDSEERIIDCDELI